MVSLACKLCKALRLGGVEINRVMFAAVRFKLREVIVSHNKRMLGICSDVGSFSFLLLFGQIRNIKIINKHMFASKY